MARRFRIVIVGAGIGGVAAALGCGLAGHDVVLLEAATEIGEVGAGIQLPPNMFRILKSWGLGKDIIRDAVSLSEIRVRRWQNGDLLGSQKANNKYGTQYVIHRADIHRLIFERAKSLPNVQVMTNSRVVDVDFDAPYVRLGDGRLISGDIVLGADGLKSTIRSIMTCEEASPKPTGDCAYRLILPRDVMESDPDLKELVDSPVGTRWIGPNRHIMAYPMKGHQLFNMVLLCPDDMKTEESWTAKATKEDLLATYRGWDPLLLKLLDKAEDDKVMKWKLCIYDPLPTWIKGKICLLGDACHPMLPYVAQGAAQAVEDAATLAIIISSISQHSHIRSALQTYESIRKRRCELIQATALDNRKSLHLPDGPDQQLRDQLFAKISLGGENPDKWGDPAHQQFLWGWDAQKIAHAAVTAACVSGHFRL